MSVDIHEPVYEICKRLDLDPAYVSRLEILPDHANVTLWVGKDGRFSGPKYIDETGQPASEEFTVKVTT